VPRTWAAAAPQKGHLARRRPLRTRLLPVRRASTRSVPTYIGGTPGQSFKFQAPMAVLSLMRSVGTPLGFANEEQPWVSSIWRTVSDSTNRVVIFDSALTPATFWVKLDELDLRAGAAVKKLELVDGRSYSGNAVAQFVDAKLFTFQDLTDVPRAK
jgi:hypothetical protein